MCEILSFSEVNLCCLSASCLHSFASLPPATLTYTTQQICMTTGWEWSIYFEAAHKPQGKTRWDCWLKARPLFVNIIQDKWQNTAWLSKLTYSTFSDCSQKPLTNSLILKTWVMIWVCFMGLINASDKIIIRASDSWKAQWTHLVAQWH